MCAPFPACLADLDFDANGNRTSDGAGTAATYTPGSDRLATINGISVTLDAAGNLSSDGTYQYLWNSLNQLAELRKPDNTLIAATITTTGTCARARSPRRLHRRA